MEYVNKWEKENGNKLSKKEYNFLSSSASKKNIPLEDYLYMYGIKTNKSVGELQDPILNNAELTTWVIEEDGKWLFLTKWRYKMYFEEARNSNKNISEFLKEEGFSLWKELFEEDITNWINKEDSLPLTRKKYIEFCNSLSNGIKVADYLRANGFKKINEKVVN